MIAIVARGCGIRSGTRLQSGFPSRPVRPPCRSAHLLAGLTLCLIELAVGPAVLAQPASATGVTQPIRELKLGLPVPGRVEGMFVREGDRVRPGQVLMHLDRTLEDLEVRRRKLLLQDDSRLRELVAKERILSEQVAALRPLVEGGSAARKQLEDEELSLGSVIAERQALQAAKRREQVELDLAIETYERRNLRSPIDGVVTRIAHRLGESVAPNEASVHVVDVSRVRFLGAVPWQQASRLRAGSVVSVRVGQDDASRARPARLVFVAPVADPSSGLVEVIAEFDNPDGSVRPGVSGRMQF
jgi:RND family efflux transporter MFP subunit